MKEELYKEYKNNPKGLEKHLESLVYKMLGWQVHTENCEELKKCWQDGHMHFETKGVFDIQHNQRGSDVTYWCEKCKHYWKIDMSD